jgi:adenylosuccinate lyase
MAATPVKAIEATTNHDVKAVEYFIKERVAEHGARGIRGEFVHFACTSRTSTTSAYALMLKEARDAVHPAAVDA